MTAWIDGHCHLPEDDAEVVAVLAQARAAGVVGFVHVGVDAATSARALELAGRFDDVAGTVGVHPHEARLGLDGIEAMVADPRCAAVGECGLDFHYDHSPRDVQRDVFAAQIHLAHRYDRTLVIHTREAWAETFAVLDAEGTPARTVFHCFTGGPDEAAEAVARGGLLSISGIVTFPSASDVRAAVAATPLDSLLVETDSPYLAPVPHRGKRNEPAFVPHVGVAVAAAGGWTAEQVATATATTARRVYGLSA